MTRTAPQIDAIPEDAPRQGRAGRLILWLVVLSLGFLFLPLYLLWITVDENNHELETDISTLQAELASSPVPSADEAELQAALTTALDRISILQPVQSQVERDHVSWPAVAVSIGNYHDDYMVLLGMTQTGRMLTLSGRAWDEKTVLEYAARLEESGYFDHVSIQSLSANILPTSTPPRETPTAAPGADSAGALPPATPSRIKYVDFVIAVELKAATQ